MSDMKCTGEKCPIPELTKDATACTAHDCKHRTPPMPDIKEKLVELINQKQVYGIDNEQPKRRELVLLDNEELADHLISNGVTIQQWISVEERLPDGGTYVLVTTDGVVAHAYRHNDRFIAFTAAGVATVGGVTHWMPLPEPPKGE